MKKLKPNLDTYNVLGLIGYSGSGKDTIFSEIDKHYKNVVRIAQGDFLVQEIGDILSYKKIMNNSEFNDTIKNKKESIRQLLIAYGEYVRSVIPNYWISKCKKRIDEAIEAKKLVVITDIRNIDTYIFLKNNYSKFIGIYVWRNGIIGNPEERQTIHEIDREYKIHQFWNNCEIEDIILNLEDHPVLGKIFNPS